MTTTSTTILALATAGWLAACGEPDAAPAPDGGVTEADLEQMLESCSEFSDIGCHMTYTCGPEADASREGIETLFGVTDEAACVPALTGFFVAICQNGAASVRAGRADYDPAAMQTCIEASRTADCPTYFGDGETPGMDGACAHFPFVDGIQPLGAACSADFECVGEARCDGADPDAGTDGVCIETGAGSRCGWDSDCGDDDHLYCDHPGNDFGGNSGDDGTCAPRGDVGDDCDDFFACLDGLNCDDVNGFDPDTGVRLPGICVPLRELGEPCNEPADCISEHCSTDDDPWLDEGVCVAP